MEEQVPVDVIRKNVWENILKKNMDFLPLTLLFISISEMLRKEIFVGVYRFRIQEDDI